jgi:hypothetical protein
VLKNESDPCHSEPFAVILSEAKDLALFAQGKLREESRYLLFEEKPGFLGPIKSIGPRNDSGKGFSPSVYAPQGHVKVAKPLTLSPLPLFPLPGEREEGEGSWGEGLFSWLLGASQPRGMTEPPL